MKRLILILITLILCIPSHIIASNANYNDFTGDYWYGIYMQNSKIGYAIVSLKETGASQWTSTTKLEMIFNIGGNQAEIQSTDNRIYKGKKAQLVASEYSSSTPMASLTVDGKIENDSYLVTTDIMGQKTEKTLALPVESLDDILGISVQIKNGTFDIGRTIEGRLFMPDPPLTKTTADIHSLIKTDQLIIGGVATKVFVVRDSLVELGIAGNNLYDENGIALILEYPSMKMEMRLETPEMAKRIDSSYDLLNENVIKAANGPDNPRDVKTAMYLVSGIPVNRLPSGDWVSVKDISTDSSQITVSRRDSDSYNQGIPVEDSNFAEYLKPTTLLQCDNPEIIKLAKNIVGDETNAFKAAELINSWVYHNIRKEFSPDISNALQTYKLGRGDCGEHTALAVALMRAEGIPARPLAGVMYWPQGKGFAYHAWVEAYVGEWIQMDPTWNETFADATHIALASGGLEEQIIAILGAFRNLRIKILSYN